MKKHLLLFVTLTLLSVQFLSAQDHHWPLKSNLNDAVGALDGTNNGLTYESDAVRGKVARFDGEGYADLPSFINGNGDNLSFTCWWRMDETVAWTRIFTFGNGDQTNPKDLLMIVPVTGVVEGGDLADSKYLFSLQDPTGWIDVEFPNSEVDVALDTWYFTAIVITLDSIILYHNDVRIMAESNLMTRSIGEMSDTENALGKSFWADPTWYGALSDVKVWNSKLSDEDVIAEYNTPLSVNGDINENIPQVYSSQKKIYVKLDQSYNDEIATVYSITGALISENPLAELSSKKFDTGIYIVKVKGSMINYATKVFVK